MLQQEIEETKQPNKQQDNQLKCYPFYPMDKNITAGLS